MNSLIRLVFVIVEMVFVVFALILGTAFILGLLGADPAAPFATWIYTRETSLMTPFEGLFKPIQLSADTTIHTSLLFGIVVYVALAGIVEMLSRNFTRDRRAD